MKASLHPYRRRDTGEIGVILHYENSGSTVTLELSEADARALARAIVEALEKAKELK